MGGTAKGYCLQWTNGENRWAEWSVLDIQMILCQCRQSVITTSRISPPVTVSSILKILSHKPGHILVSLCLHLSPPYENKFSRFPFHSLTHAKSISLLYQRPQYHSFALIFDFLFVVVKDSVRHLTRA